MTDRLEPLSDEDWPEDIADLRAGFAGQLNVYRTMAHDPELLRAWAPLREHLVRQSALGPILTEVVILRTGVRLGSDYEWAHHVVRARRLGMSDARIASIRTAAPDGDDALIVRAVDELIEGAELSRPTRGALMARFGRKATLDLIATVGFYFVLGSILKTFGTPIDDDIAAELAARPLS